MIFRQLIAFPESRRIFKIHLLATPFLAVQWALVAMIPVLLRDHFCASKWQTTISTSAIPVMSILSIMWNEVYRRVSPRRYLLLLWVIGILPVAGIALCHRSETALLFVVTSAVGFGAMTPITGDILRSCYPPITRGRVFSVLQVVNQSTIMMGTYTIGVWLKISQESFRLYMPLGAVLIGTGMVMLVAITRERLFLERHRAHPTERFRTSLLNATRHMLAVLKADQSFRRYEMAFFIYGLGWMTCYALVPFLVVDRLKLNYEQIARSTQTIPQLVLLLMMLPTGYLIDRHGAIRTSGWAFAILALYPIGLLLSHDANSLTLVTMGFAVGMSAVQLTWTLGPVALAKDASHAPHYLAIHGTMVGLRASPGQFMAVALYQLTGFFLPLMLGSLFFVGGCILMLRLARDHSAAEAKPVAVIPEEPPPVKLG